MVWLVLADYARLNSPIPSLSSLKESTHEAVSARPQQARHRCPFDDRATHTERRTRPSFDPPARLLAQFSRSADRQRPVSGEREIRSPDPGVGRSRRGDRDRRGGHAFRQGRSRPGQLLSGLGRRPADLSRHGHVARRRDRRRAGRVRRAAGTGRGQDSRRPFLRGSGHSAMRRCHSVARAGRDRPAAVGAKRAGPGDRRRIHDRVANRQRQGRPCDRYFKQRREAGAGQAL